MLLQLKKVYNAVLIILRVLHVQKLLAVVYKWVAKKDLWSKQDHETFAWTTNQLKAPSVTPFVQVEKVCRFVYNPRELSLAAIRPIKTRARRFVTIVTIYFFIMATSIFLAASCQSTETPLLVYESVTQGDSVIDVLFPFTCALAGNLNHPSVSVYKVVNFLVVLLFESTVCVFLFIECFIEWVTPDVFWVVSQIVLVINTLFSAVVISPILGVVFICVKFLLIFGYIVLVRTTTPRFKLETISKLGWLYVLIFLAAIFIVYLLGFFLF